MQISKCCMRTRYCSKTFNIFLLKFQDMYNTLKYEFKGGEG